MEFQQVSLVSLQWPFSCPPVALWGGHWVHHSFGRAFLAEDPWKGPCVGALGWRRHMAHGTWRAMESLESSRIGAEVQLRHQPWLGGRKAHLLSPPGADNGPDVGRVSVVSVCVLFPGWVSRPQILLPPTKRRVPLCRNCAQKAQKAQKAKASSIHCFYRLRCESENKDAMRTARDEMQWLLP